MRRLFWILTGCGVLYLAGRAWRDAHDLQSTIEEVTRQVDSLERAVRDLRS